MIRTRELEGSRVPLKTRVIHIGKSAYTQTRLSLHAGQNARAAWEPAIRAGHADLSSRGWESWDATGLLSYDGVRLPGSSCYFVSAVRSQR